MAAPLFLNDASYPVPGDDQEVGACLLALLRALKRTQDVGLSVYVISAVPLSQVQITEDLRTIASISRVMDYEWWRFLRAMEQFAPFIAAPRTRPPKHHSVNPQPFDAGPWAAENDGFLLSLGSGARWNAPEIELEVCSCADTRHDDAERVRIKNISLEGHVDRWAGELRASGETQAGSTEIFRGVDFRVRMYLMDHSPPHVHVFLTADPLCCVAKVRFDVPAELLEDKGLRGRVRGEVLRFVDSRRAELLRSWERCQAGEHPNVLVE